jgi:hypothetical protein
VSGQLDDRTLGVLGVQREDAQASAGSTTEEQPERESEAYREADRPLC